MNFQSLQNNFLIAMPSLMDPNFFQTVTLICEHNDHGALGIVINHPLDIRFEEILDQLSIPANDKTPDIPVFNGGPVQQDRGFVVHTKPGGWKSSLQVGDSIHITTSMDIIEAIASGELDEPVIIVLGYAGWDAGQLEVEISENSWLHVPTQEHIVFDLPSNERWEAAAQIIGIDIHNLSSDIGHS